MKRLKQLYRQQFAVELTEDKWDCDIISVMNERINEYNAVVEYDPGNKFKNTTTIKKSIGDLLREDAVKLSESYHEILSVLPLVHFSEALDPHPNACVFTAPTGSTNDEFLILFNRPMLKCIHAFFGVQWLLTQTDKRENLTEQHFSRVMSKEWADHYIWIALMRDIENFYSKGSFEAINSSEHLFLHVPYDYCEQVIFARRFIVAHELAHILLGHHVVAQRAHLHSGDQFDAYIFSRDQEYEADSLALKIIVSPYCNTRLTQEESVEFINAVRGIKSFFTLLLYAERMLGWSEERSSHPRARMRLHNIQQQFDANAQYPSDVRLSSQWWDHAISGFHSLMNPYAALLEMHPDAQREPVRSEIYRIWKVFNWAARDYRGLNADELRLLYRQMRFSFGPNGRFFFEQHTHMNKRVILEIDLDVLSFDPKTVELSFNQEPNLVERNVSNAVSRPFGEDILPSIVAQIKGKTNSKNVDGGVVSSIVVVSLQILTSVMTGIASNWIFEKIKGSQKIWLNGDEVELNKEAIENWIKLKIESTHKQVDEHNASLDAIADSEEENNSDK